MSVFEGLLHALSQDVIGLRATQYTIVACSALLGYDYLLTLDREVFYVWGSKWSFGKIIFFLNRYTPFIDTTLAIYVLTGVKVTDQSVCAPIARATGWLFLSGMYISEIILAMRTYAIWSGRRSILIFLVLFLLAIFTSGAVLMQLFLNSLTWIPITPFLESLGIGITCAPIPAPGKTYLEFVVFMINQVVVAFLTLYRGLYQYRITRHPMVKTMFQDGLLYYIYALVLAVANVTVAFAAPIQYSILLELPLRVISSICCTRVLLNIRGAYFNPNETTHNGVVTFKDSKWESDETGTVFFPSDSEETAGAYGWMWPDYRSGAPPELVLRPISPFECEPPEIV